MSRTGQIERFFCILWRGGVSCPVSAAWHFCVAAHWSKHHCYKQAPSWYDLRCFKATLKPKQTNKQIVHSTFQSRWSFFTWAMLEPKRPDLHCIITNIGYSFCRSLIPCWHCCSTQFININTATLYLAIQFIFKQTHMSTRMFVSIYQYIHKHKVEANLW